MKLQAADLNITKQLQALLQTFFLIYPKIINDW